jgi:maltooligosyltrehalose trehalohydrolase
MIRAQRDRRLPIGAEVLPAGGVHFRVWAPNRRQVVVVLGQRGDSSFSLAAEEGGYFSGHVMEARAGTLYRFQLDGGEPRPDPASRFQPDGPLGPSQVIDPLPFQWTDHGWKGVPLRGQVLYEMHVGTFTRQGTWAAAERELPAVADLGVTAVEVMPVAEFFGRFGWGYDGVDLFAPTRLYGTPDDFRRFVDRAHGLGVGVILDVVYNHLGPVGNFLKEFSEDYFTSRYENEWGEAINFDGPGAGPVREFFLANARCWVEEFHIDGLRLDATQAIFDASAEHVLAALSRHVREAAAGRATLLIAENEPQQVRLVRPPAEGGYGLDALWNDDFHHSAMVVLSGHNEAYYTDYKGAPQEFISAAKWGYLYQGQRYKWQKKRRGTPAFGVEPAAFVTFIQNHDQVANSARGLRAHRLASFGRYKAMTALLLLGPGTPMLFQGQEFAASSPFYYFADGEGELARLIAEGRAKSLAQFRTVASAEAQRALADPADPATFERSKLDHAERERHAEVYALHRDLLRLRREEPAFSAQRSGGMDGAVIGPEAFVLRFFGPRQADRLLAVNFGSDLHLDPAPEPLLAPPEGMRWGGLWSSEELRYGGCGTAPVETEENWRFPGHAAVVLTPVAEADGRSPP